MKKEIHKNMKILLKIIIIIIIGITITSCSNSSPNTESEPTRYLEYNMIDNSYSVKMIDGTDIPETDGVYYVDKADNTLFIYNDSHKIDITDVKDLNLGETITLPFDNQETVSTIYNTTNTSHIFCKFYITENENTIPVDDYVQTPFLNCPNFSFTINLSLPVYSNLQFPANSFIFQNGINGVIVVNTGSEYRAYEMSCPNHAISSCSVLTLNGNNLTCQCDNYQYNIMTGKSNNNLQYQLRRYLVVSNNNILTISN
jgi:nitrite reductase/ring-hydroxylating ferredoxin subunit